MVGKKEGVKPISKQPPQARIWNLLVIQGLSERKAADAAQVKRNQVQKWKNVWIGAGWAITNDKGGLIPTEKAPKNLVGEWSDTPEGSPLTPPAPIAHRITDPHRLHRRKMKGVLDRSVDITTKRFMVKGSRHGSSKAISYTFHLRAETLAGISSVPVQVIQRHKDQPHTVMIQSCNVFVSEASLRSLDYYETHAWVKDQMNLLVRSWLGDDAVHLSELEFVGLENEDMEVAWEAHKDAKVGGDVQKDGHGVDRSDPHSPWPKEEEITLRVKKELDQLQKVVGLLEANQERLTALINQGFSGIHEQLDAITYLEEENASRK